MNSELISKTLACIAALKDGWNNDGDGTSISADTLKYAKMILDAMPAQNKTLIIAPVSDGGIMIECDIICMNVHENICGIWYPETMERDYTIPDELRDLIYAFHCADSAQK
jgi:hypothetical protein